MPKNKGRWEENPSAAHTMDENIHALNTTVIYLIKLKGKISGEKASTKENINKNGAQTIIDQKNASLDWKNEALPLKGKRARCKMADTK